MNNNVLTPKMALEHLFEASRLAKMTAQEHFLAQQCKKVLEELIIDFQNMKYSDINQNTDTPVVDKKN